MTEYMYTMGLMDPRIPKFIFLVRWWAKEFKVTRNYRDNFTNFHLTYMCLSFLLQLKDPLIPTFDDVIERHGFDEVDNILDISKKSFAIGFDCDRIQFKSENTSTVLELFTQFLQYFGSFDFDTQAITVKTNKKISKFDVASVFLENPFDSSSKCSVADNVSNAECISMQIVMRETLEELEQCSDKPMNTQQDWGLLEIIRHLK